MSELSFEQQTAITDILEAYRSNPSNSNKYRYELFAYVNNLLINAQLELANKLRKNYINDTKKYYKDPVKQLNEVIVELLTKGETN